MANSKPAFESTLRIAVVDDHEGSRVGICRLLGRRGLASCSFGSVAEFIGSNEPRRIDCLLLDVCMPDIDGIALQTCLKHTNFKFPIIFCTGLELDARLHSALADGAFAVLRKPLRGDALLETIHAACRAGNGAKKPR